MSGLVTFLLFGAAFFFMMRFGCGAHAGHGGHHGGAHDGDNDATKGDVDPVCGMRVAADSTYSNMYQGTQYRFCSRECADKFAATPERYAGHSSHAAGHGGHCA